MRYYDIQIFTPPDKDGNPGKLFKQYSSLKNGVFNPGNLMIEFDIQRFGESTPKGQSRITIWDRPERYAAGQTKHVWHDDKNVGGYVEGVAVGKTCTARAGLGGNGVAGAGKLAGN